MKRIEIAAAFAGALAWTVLQTTTAPAQAIAPNGNILVDYMEPLEPSMYLNMRPDDPRYKDDYKKFRAEYDRLNDVHERLQRRQLLEELSQFLSPLRLPVNLRLVARQCMGSNVINAFFSPSDRSITLCYQYVRYFEELYDKLERRKANFAGIGRGEALTGTIVSTMLHETGHAVFSLLQVPVLGREEDASDQIAAYVMLQFGKPVARTAVRGTAWKWYSKDWEHPLLWDVHSPPEERFRSYACIAYGGDPALFKDFLQPRILPETRAKHCKQEYEQAKQAFEDTLMKHIDPDRLKRVQAKQWLRPEDYK